MMESQDEYDEAYAAFESVADENEECGQYVKVAKLYDKAVAKNDTEAMQSYKEELDIMNADVQECNARGAVSKYQSAAQSYSGVTTARGTLDDCKAVEKTARESRDKALNQASTVVRAKVELGNYSRMRSLYESASSNSSKHSSRFAYVSEQTKQSKD